MAFHLCSSSVYLAEFNSTIEFQIYLLPVDVGGDKVKQESRT